MDGEEGGLLVVGHGHGVGGGHQGDAEALGGQKLGRLVAAQGQDDAGLLDPRLFQNPVHHLADALLFVEHDKAFCEHVATRIVSMQKA